MNEHLFDLVLKIFELLVLPTIIFAINSLARYFKSKKAISNNELVGIWAKGFVALAEREYKNILVDKNNQKLNFVLELINERLKANGLQYKFSEEQIKGFIEIAVGEMKREE